MIDVESEHVLIEALERRGCKIRGMSCTCPNPEHDDKTPSASIRQTDGHWRVKCHKCNMTWDAWDLLAEDTGKSAGELMREANKNDAPRLSIKKWSSYSDVKAAFPRAEAFHPYTNHRTGNIDLIIVRRPYGADSQKVSQIARDSISGTFSPGGIQGPQPIYNRRRIASTDGPVVVVEGEKDVETLHCLGIVATTSPGGSGNAGKADWSLLAGRDVYMWPDRDEPGKKYAKDVVSCLQRLSPPPSIRSIDPDELDLPKDVTDYVAKFNTDADALSHVDAVLSQAQPVSCIQGMLSFAKELLDGRRTILRWPSFCFLDSVCPLATGAVLVLCGPEGSGKSLFIGQCIADMVAHGEQIGALMLEKDNLFYQNRLLAQVEGAAHYTDERWIVSNYDDYCMASMKNETLIHRMTNAMETTTDGMGSKEILGWVERQASSGKRLIIVDPLSGMNECKDMAEDHKKMMKALSAIAHQYRCTVMVTTHPRNGSISAPTLDGIYGGKGVTRFADYVMWIVPLPDDNAGPVVTMGGTLQKDYNRKLTLLKTRSSKGEGMSVAMRLDREKLRFVELGSAVREKGKH